MATQEEKQQHQREARALLEDSGRRDSASARQNR